MQIRVHGRGGQGVVTLAELLAHAAFDAGLQAQAFPSFGSERMGAPVMSFCRVSRRPIHTRQPVTEPDAVLVCDATLLHSVQVFDGLARHGTVLINSAKSISELGVAELVEGGARVELVPATELARAEGYGGKPNSVMLGASAYVLGIFSLQLAETAFRRRFGSAVPVGLVEAGYRHLAGAELPELPDGVEATGRPACAS